MGFGLLEQEMKNTKCLLLMCRRSLNGQKSLDVKKDGESMKEIDKKLEEVKANQQRMEDNMKNLKQEIIDEIRGSVSNISYMRYYSDYRLHRWLRNGSEKAT